MSVSVSALIERQLALVDSGRVESVLRRTGDLWPEGLETVPGSYEVALKQDADTIRELASAAPLLARQLQEAVRLLREWTTGDPYKHDWADFEERVRAFLARLDTDNGKEPE